MILLLFIPFVAGILLIWWAYDDIRTAVDDYREREFLSKHRNDPPS